jgi:DNA-binding transcriptional LysR family regulator
VARPLSAYERILAASPDYLARHGEPTTPAQLSAHVCLGLSYWRRRDRWKLAGPDGAVYEVAVSGSRFTSNNGNALRMAALHGAGIVLQPEVLLADDIAAGRLVRVLPAWAYMPTPMYLIYAQDRRPTAKLRSLIDFIVDRFGVHTDRKSREQAAPTPARGRCEGATTKGKRKRIALATA